MKVLFLAGFSLAHLDLLIHQLEMDRPMSIIMVDCRPAPANPDPWDLEAQLKELDLLIHQIPPKVRIPDLTQELLAMSRELTTYQAKIRLNLMDQIRIPSPISIRMMKPPFRKKKRILPPIRCWR